MKYDDDTFFADPIPPQVEARERMLEALRRLLIWLADADTMEARGIRASIALYCVQPDLIACATLEDIGQAVGQTPQAMYRLVDSFRDSIGLAS